MRFGQKIFILSFLLIILSIHMIGIMMINHTYESNIESQIDKSILQMNAIMSNLSLYNNMNGISQIANQYLKDGIHIEIDKSGTMIFTNLMQEYPQIKSNIMTEDSKSIKVYMQEDLLFMAGHVEDYTIITTTDISGITQIKKQQIQFFSKISLICSFVIALILYIGVSLVTRKIKQLNRGANQLSQGNYDVRIKNLGKDEVGNLAKTFNEMAKAIETQISTIYRVSENRKYFIDNLTHEIRTPLTSIIGYSSLMKNKKVSRPEQVVEYAEKIHEEGTYIKGLSDKLMDIVLLENQKIELQSISLSQSLTTILEELSFSFPTLQIQSQIEKNVWVMSDAVLIKSLLMNLVKNSIHAYENQKAVVRIELDKDATLRVIDYGKGIPKQELERIMNPFYTLSKDRNRSFSGMGLGLPLCQKIVDIHQGSLEIESEEGKRNASDS